MKKTYIVFLLFLLIMNIVAKEMQLYNNDTGEKEFSELELEEQYNSYMNSFRYIKMNVGSQLNGHGNGKTI